MTGTKQACFHMLQGNSVWQVSFVAAFFALVVVTAYPAHAVTIDWVTVGKPGNAADASTGRGAVANAYRAGKFEVTNSQYAEFLNAVAVTDTFGLFNSSMGSDPLGGITQSGSSGSFTYSVRANMGNKPVNFASFLDSSRFINWLHNGQPTGVQDSTTTEDGAYTFSGATTVGFRNPGARFFLPTFNEWFKAAYYDPRTAAQGGPPGDDNYWLYPTQSDSVPTVATASAIGDVSNPGPNVANYLSGADWNGQDGNLTTVGSASSTSFYGGLDMGGNVHEWTETPVPGNPGANFVLNGWYSSTAAQLSAPNTSTGTLVLAGNASGFRVFSPIIPEPNTLFLAALGLLSLGMIGWRRRRR